MRSLLSPRPWGPALILVLSGAFAFAAPAAATAPPSLRAPDATTPQLARGFGGGGFGSRGFGSRGFGSRPRGFFGGRSRLGRRTGFFRRALHALAFAYLLHLLFTTPGGLVVLLLMIGLVLWLVTRLRRRRSAFG